jgi:hypothetical protein
MGEKQPGNGKPKYIRKFVKQRGIRDLFHFTRVENIESIMSRGLVSVSELRDREVPFVASDSERRDGRLDGVSLSVSFPNWKMFYNKRVNSDAPTHWVVLSVRPSVLWTHRVEFFTYNAASAEMIDSDRSTHVRSSAFRELFASEHRMTEKGSPLPKRFPTQNQAELLVFDPILPRDFQYCVVGTEELTGRVLTVAPDLEVRLVRLRPNGDAIDPGVFSTLDYFVTHKGNPHG